MEQETKGIRYQSEHFPTVQGLMGCVNEQSLMEEHRRQSGKKATGIDGVDKAEYDRNAEENIRDLIERMKKFQYKSVMEIPKIDKVVVNVGSSEAKDNAKVVEAIIKDITTITGQKAVPTKAKKSVANFKVREGQTVGVKVTLRQDRMWEFLDRLFNVALPRVRDFRGINPNSFDGRGNYCFGIKEQLIFPEIEYDKVDAIRGMDVVICTTAKTDEEAKELLTLVGAPFYS